MTGLTLALLLSTSAHALEQDAVPEPTSRTEQELLERNLKRALRLGQCNRATRFLGELERGWTEGDAQTLHRCYFKARQWEEAAGWGQRALDPSEGEQLELRSKVMLASWRAGDPVRAVRLARWIEARAPLHPQYLRVRARIALESGHPEQAQDWLRQLSPRRRSGWRAQAILAEIALAEGDLFHAELHAQRVVDKVPGHVMGRAILAECMRRSGSPEAALAALGPDPEKHNPLWAQTSLLVDLDLGETELAASLIEMNDRLAEAPHVEPMPWAYALGWYHHRALGQWEQALHYLDLYEATGAGPRYGLQAWIPAVEGELGGESQPPRTETGHRMRSP